MVEAIVYVSVPHVCAAPALSKIEFMDDNIDATSLGTVFIIMHHLDTPQYHFPSKSILVFAEIILSGLVTRKADGWESKFEIVVRRKYGTCTVMRYTYF